MSNGNNGLAKPQSFPQMLQTFLPEIKRALPKHMDGDRMARIALTEFRKNPKLGECDPKSVFASIIIGAQLGLEPGIMGQAFLVAYWNRSKNINECQLIPGWQGINDLVSRAGRATTWTSAVRQGDSFEYNLGDRPFINHKPGDDESAPIIHFYAVGRIRGSEWPIIEVWSFNRAVKHRDKYNKVGDRHYSYQNFEMYGRKVVLLQVIKYLPKSPELATAVALENAAHQGQDLTIESAIEGTWAPANIDAGEDQNNAPTETITQPQAKSQATAAPAAPSQAPAPSTKPAADLMQDTPIGENLIPVIQAKLEQAALTDQDLFKHFNVGKFEDFKTSQLDTILGWIKNPG